jgi:hypothetical protein
MIDPATLNQLLGNLDDPTTRKIAADALTDCGREEEATLLRSGKRVFVSSNGMILGVNPQRLDDFTKAYIDSAFQVTQDKEGRPLKDNYTIEDIRPTSLANIQLDCLMFLADNNEDIDVNQIRAGQEFFLTRNQLSMGFSDRDWSPEVRERLTKAAQAFGEFELYVDDEGLIREG